MKKRSFVVCLCCGRDLLPPTGECVCEKCHRAPLRHEAFFVGNPRPEDPADYPEDLYVKGWSAPYSPFYINTKNY